MGSRRSPTGPLSNLTGFVTVGDTAVTSSTAVSSFSAIARISIGPAGTAFANMNGKVMSTNDQVSVSPRVVPIGTTAGVPVNIAWARIASVESATVSTAVAIVQIGLAPQVSGAAGVAVSNTYDISVALRSADL
jgi:hypothetical protein